MKTIIILRHAQAHPAHQTDFQRHLTKTGRADARAFAQILRKQKLRPDFVISSAAPRAAETARCVAAKTPTKTLKSLYAASADYWLEKIRKLPEKVQTVLLVGHNPELESLVLALTNQHIKLKKSTAAVMEFNEQWTNLTPAAAHFLYRLSPFQTSKPAAAKNAKYIRWTDKNVPAPPPPQNRELSWLSFNERVLQEASEPDVPPLDRLKFISIVSANLDEFFRVRVGAMESALHNKKHKKQTEKLRHVFAAIDHRAAKLQRQLESRLFDTCDDLAQRGIELVGERDLTEEERNFCRKFCDKHIRPGMTVLTDLKHVAARHSIITDNAYLTVTMTSDKGETQYALIHIPTDQMERFVELPKQPRRNTIRITWLDDIIRASLPDIFGHFGFTSFSAHTIKLTRSADLSEDDKFGKNLISAAKSREKGAFVRLVYDRKIPADILEKFIKLLRLNKNCSLIPDGGYSNISDFNKFPHPKTYPELSRRLPEALPHPALSRAESLLDTCAAGDHLLHFPYHDFSILLKLLREASVDPEVTSIQMTIYRLAQKSQVAGALLNALANGKKVFCMVEQRARFDEDANIRWIQMLKEAGASIGQATKYKTHAKAILINRAPKDGSARDIAVLSTGNFNEKNARIYSDIALMTADKTIVQDVSSFFHMLHHPARRHKFKRLIVSPMNMRDSLIQMIRSEAKNALAKKPCGIHLKLNNLSETKLIKELEKAAAAGVPISLIIRGICGLDPELPQLGGNIKAISIIDSLLEHARIMIFENNGSPRVFIGSADWMPRNIERRQEIYTPVTDSRLAAELRMIMQIQEADNMKARVLNSAQDNTRIRRRGRQKPHNAQQETREFYRRLQQQTAD